MWHESQAEGMRFDPPGRLSDLARLGLWRSSGYIHAPWRTREALLPEGGLNVLMGTIHTNLWGARRGSLQG
jgi:hypothetical protein